MGSKILTKAVCGALALATLAGYSVSMTGCERIKEILSDGETTTTATTQNGDNSYKYPDVQVEFERDPALKITELMTSNTVGITDENGNYSPWIEIQNISKSTVNLSGYKLSVFDVDEIQLPDVSVAAGEYCVLFINGGQGSHGIDLTVPAIGTLILYHGDYATDKVNYLNVNANCSFLASTGGETSQPTPGYESVREKDSIVISELMSTNDLYPVKGLLDDWIEVYNSGIEPVNLSNYYLTDSNTNFYRCKLPDITVSAGEYCVLASGIDFDFGMSKSGDSVYLVRNDGVVTSSVVFDAMEKNTSWTWDTGISSLPSPGFANTALGSEMSITARGGLVISEVITSNTKYKQNGGYYDCIELYNNSDAAIDLSEYYVSDKSSDLQKFNLPAVTLGAGEYYIVCCGEDADGVAPFGISGDGEKIYVSDSHGYVWDALDVPHIPANRSWGRYGGMLVYFTTPTLGKVNPLGYNTVTAQPVASVTPGCYTSTQYMLLSGEGNIYYTTDGTVPTKSSKLYSGEVITLDTTMTVRAIAYNGDRIPSEVTTFGYVIGEPNYTLPIVSVAISENDFYGSNGLYTKYNNDIEKEVGVTYIEDGTAKFTINCGMKVFGASSRQYAKKSYQLKFRAVYGYSSLDYKIFDDLDITQFESLVLRSGSQSMMSYRSMFTDELITSLASTSGNMPTVMVQAYKPVNLYINGEYMGVYFLREKIDDDFVAAHWGVDAESVTIINWVNTVKYGSDDQGWHELWDFVYTQKADLTDPDNYKWVVDQLNLESFIDVYCIRMWGGDRDTGNIRAVKSEQYDNGRWNFMLFDCDLCLDTGSTESAINYFMNNTNLNYLHTLFRALMKNAEFKDAFLTRLGYHTSNTFSAELAQARLDVIYNQIANDMQYNVVRWANYYHKTYSAWVSTVNAIRKNTIGTGRIKYLIKDAAKTFGLSEEQVIKYFGEEYVQYM